MKGTKGQKRSKVATILLALWTLVATSACSARTPPPTSPPTPTPPIRYRDALPLMLSLQDLGKGYETVEMYRLEQGKGWDEQSTRLSGYRALYRGVSGGFESVLCQVECYLSFHDAQVAYRAYKSKLTDELKSDRRYDAISDEEVSVLGEWGWRFNLRAQDKETYHYIFVRENVLVEMSITGQRSPDLADRSIRLAQIVDRRIAALP